MFETLQVIGILFVLAVCVCLPDVLGCLIHKKGRVVLATCGTALTIAVIIPALIATVSLVIALAVSAIIAPNSLVCLL